MVVDVKKSLERLVKLTAKFKVWYFN
jgi:hypothetical protein